MVNIPLSVIPTTNNNLLISGGGKQILIPMPIDPFELVESDSDTEGELVNMIGGGTLRIIKKEYSTVPVKVKRDNKTVPQLDYTLWLIKGTPGCS